MKLMEKCGKIEWKSWRWKNEVEAEGRSPYLCGFSWLSLWQLPPTCAHWRMWALWTAESWLLDDPFPRSTSWNSGIGWCLRWRRLCSALAKWGSELRTLGHYLAHRPSLCHSTPASGAPRLHWTPSSFWGNFSFSHCFSLHGQGGTTKPKYFSTRLKV